MIVNLFSTANMASGRPEALKRMLGSVAAARGTCPQAEIRLMLLAQNCPDAAAAQLTEAERAFTVLMTIPGLVSLSEARNRLLEEAERRDWFAADGFTAFPDDDCWYPDGVLRHLHETFAADPALDLWFCDYASNPQALDPAMQRPATVPDVLRRASSNTMVFRNRIVPRIGPFDTELGVGTSLNGSEDTDYALRAYALARRAVFLPQACIGHRDRNTTLRAKYYPAGLYVIARHAATMPGLRLHLARKAAIGAALAMRSEIAPAAFARSLKAAAAEWRRARRGATGPRRA